MAGRTVVVVNAGRMQPYTVWVQGQVIFFTDSRTEADARLAAARERLAVNGGA